MDVAEQRPGLDSSGSSKMEDMAQKWRDGSNSGGSGNTTTAVAN